MNGLRETKVIGGRQAEKEAAVRRSLRSLASTILLLVCIEYAGCSKNPVAPAAPVFISDWTQCQGMPTLSSGFARSGNNLVAGTDNALLSQAYIFISSDGGLNWSLDAAFHTLNHDTSTAPGPQPGPLFTDTPVTFLDDGPYLFAGIGGEMYGGNNVYVSTDNGITWVERDTSFIVNVNCFAAVGGIIFAGTGGGVFLSTDYGTSWSSANTGMLSRGTGYGYTVSRVASVATNIFVCTEGFGIFRSTNIGASWVKVYNTDLDFQSLAKIGSSVFAGFAGGDPNGGVLGSIDNGASWALLNLGAKAYSVTGLCAYNSNLFAATNIGLFVSTDMGASWTYASAGTPIDSSEAGALIVYNSYLLVSTSRGLWRGLLSKQ